MRMKAGVHTGVQTKFWQTLKLVAGRDGEADVGVEVRCGILVHDELRGLAPRRVPCPGQ